MKAIFLAAAAVLASPVLAQTGGSDSGAMSGSPTTQGSTTGQTGTMAGQPGTTDGTAADQTMQNDPSTQSQMGQSQMNQPQSSGSMNGSSGSMNSGGMATPTGGYQPSQSALSGPAQPGVQPQFQAAQSPDQAYPAPAPLAKYPVCKKGQYDKCIQRGGK